MDGGTEDLQEAGVCIGFGSGSRLQIEGVASVIGVVPDQRKVGAVSSALEKPRKLRKTEGTLFI